MANVTKSVWKSVGFAVALAAAGSAAQASAQEREGTAAEPIRIAVLADTSQSMELSINDMRQALRGFFKEMGGSAEIALFEFGERPVRLVNYTRDPVLLEAGVRRLFARPGSGSYVLDAIVEASQELGLRETGKSVIVVISGQGPEFSQRFHQTVLKDLRASRATLHSIVLTRPRVSILRDDVRERELTLTEGASITGGRREDLLTSMSLTKTLADLARQLKSTQTVIHSRPE